MRTPSLPANEAASTVNRPVPADRGLPIHSSVRRHAPPIGDDFRYAGLRDYLVDQQGNAPEPQTPPVPAARVALGSAAPLNP